MNMILLIEMQQILRWPYIMTYNHSGKDGLSEYGTYLEFSVY